MQHTPAMMMSKDEWLLKKASKLQLMLLSYLKKLLLQRDIPRALTTLKIHKSSKI